MVLTTKLGAPVFLGAAVAMGCGGGDAGDQAEPEVASPSVSIASPMDGARVEGPVTIRLGAAGVEIVAAGIDQPMSGHHHLFINRSVSAVGEPILTEQGIVHLGAAQVEHTFDSLAPGSYTVIAVLGNFQHIRMGNVASDTVRFEVR